MWCSLSYAISTWGNHIHHSRSSVNVSEESPIHPPPSPPTSQKMKEPGEEICLLDLVDDREWNGRENYLLIVQLWNRDEREPVFSLANHKLFQNNMRGYEPFTVIWLLRCVQLFCNPMDCSPPGSSVHGISQARILEWVAISLSKGSSWPRDQTHVSSIGSHALCHWANWEACCHIYTDDRNTWGMLMSFLVYLEIYKCVCLGLKDKVANSKIGMHAYNVR